MNTNAAQTLSFPAEGETFSLTLDADHKDNQPIAIAVKYGGLKESEWKHVGTKLTRTLTKPFKLVAQLEDSTGLVAVKEQITPHGAIPGGQWCKAFWDTYQQVIPRRDLIIGVADDSWATKHTWKPNVWNTSRFPRICTAQRRLAFHWNFLQFKRCQWLWLVHADE